MSIITNVLSQFTEEFLEEVSSTVYTNGWQNAGGVMPFADAMGVFRNLLGELMAADAEGLVDGMPRGLQQGIHNRLNSIYSYLSYMRNGSNQVPQFTDEVDRLHMEIWNGGFRYRGKTVIGYESKYQQAVKLAQQAEHARQYLTEIEQMVKTIQQWSQQVQQTLDIINNAKNTADTQVQQLHSVLQHALSAQSQVQSYLEQISTLVKQASDAAANADTSASAATRHERRAQQFIETVDQKEKQLVEAVRAASEAVEKARNDYQQFQMEKQSQVDNLLNRLYEIEKDIKDKLAKATGITLFHSFEARQKRIIGHWIWLAIGLLVLVGSLWFAHDLLTNVNSLDVAFFVKLGFTLPALAVVGFALRQYSRERRLKEEYAFKSAISLSLEAYRNLVEQAVDKLTPEEKVRFADFLLNSIHTVFDPPTDRVFGEPRLQGATDTRVIMQLLNVLKQIKDIVDVK